MPGGGATVAGVALLVDGDAFQETSALDGEPVVGERGRGEVAMLVDLELMEVATHEARFEAGGDGELHPVVGVVAAGDGALLAISGDRERLVEAEPLVVPVDDLLRVPEPEVHEDAVSVVDHHAGPPTRLENAVQLAEDRARMRRVVQNPQAVYVVDALGAER